MNYGQAIAELQNGKKVMREGWNGKGMYIVLFSCSSFICAHAHPDQNLKPEELGGVGYDQLIGDSKVSGQENISHLGFYDENTDFFPLQDFTLLKTAQDTMVPWLPSQTDQLSDDWVLYNHIGIPTY